MKYERWTIAKYWFGLPVLALTVMTPPMALAAKAEASADNVIAGSSVPWVSEKEAGAAGAKATKYRSKTFTFPVGAIRILEFKKSAGGVFHKITSERELYVVKGATEVGVKDGKETLTAGDAVNLPNGTLQSPPTDVQDTTVVLFTVPNSSSSPVGGTVREKDAKVMTPAPAAMPDGTPGTAITIRGYSFDGNSIRFVSMKKPGRTAPNAHSTDSVLYLLSGKMRFTSGAEVTLVKAGDAVHEIAGVPSSWEVLEDSIFVSTSAPATSSGAK